MREESPLKQLFQQRYPDQGQAGSFLQFLQTDKGYEIFKSQTTFEPTLRMALARFLRKQLQQTIQSEAQRSHLTSLIPLASRKVPGLQFADISLAAPIHTQGMQLQYRRGVFLFNMLCVCNERFQRGHEEKCQALSHIRPLNRQQQKRK